MRIKLLIVFASLLTLIFAVNLGVASADGPHLGPDNNDLSKSGAAGPHILWGPGPDAGSANGAINGFGYDFAPATGPGPCPDCVDLENPAVIGITHSPLCPLHPADPE